MAHQIRRVKNTTEKKQGIRDEVAAYGRTRTRNCSSQEKKVGKKMRASSFYLCSNSLSFLFAYFVCPTPVEAHVLHLYSCTRAHRSQK